MKIKLKAEDIVFWILIALIVGVAIWKLVGSPTDTATLISIVLFFACSEILLWKALFSVDKKTSVGFMKIKNEIEKQHSETNNNLNNLNLSINKIESILVKRK